MFINFNADNTVNLTGRIESNIEKGTFKNADGSYKMLVTLAVNNSYPNKDGSYGKQDIPVQIFIPAKMVKTENGVEKFGIYSTLRTGDLVNVIGHLEANNYVDKNGQKVYGGLIVFCDHIRHREPKSVADAREANKVAAAQPTE